MPTTNFRHFSANFLAKMQAFVNNIYFIFKEKYRQIVKYLVKYTKQPMEVHYAQR